MSFKNQNKRFKIENISSTIVWYVDFEKSTLSDGIITKKIVSTRMRVIDHLLASFLESPEENRLGFISYEDMYLASHPRDAEGRWFKKDKVISMMNKMCDDYAIFQATINNVTNEGYTFTGKVMEQTSPLRDIVNPTNNYHNSKQVFFSNRETIDRDYPLARLQGAHTIYSMTLAGPMLIFGESSRMDISKISPQELFPGLDDVKIHMILPQGGSEAEKTAIKNNLRTINTFGGPQELTKRTRFALVAAAKEKPNVEARFTKIPIPFAVLIALFEDSTKNFAKIDLYSPFGQRFLDRRSFVISAIENAENFDFFCSQFESFWEVSLENPPDCK